MTHNLQDNMMTTDSIHTIYSGQTLQTMSCGFVKYISKRNNQSCIWIGVKLPKRLKHQMVKNQARH